MIRETAAFGIVVTLMLIGVMAILLAVKVKDQGQRITALEQRIGVVR